MSMRALDLSRDDIRKIVEEAAERLGDRDLARAARVMRQQFPGRTPINDGAALTEMRLLLTSGKPVKLHAALLRVARSLYPYDNPRSVAERLRRKLKNSSIK